MDRILRKHLDSFVVVFIDDILEYLANNHHGLRENSKRVLDVLSEKNLFAEQMKCAFSLEEVSLLCHVVSKYGNAVHPKKIEATVEWDDQQAFDRFVLSRASMVLITGLFFYSPHCQGLSHH